MSLPARERGLKHFRRINQSDAILLLHRSGVNSTDTPPRGFSVCYMNGKAKRVDERAEHTLPRVFLEGALTAEEVTVREREIGV